MKIQLKSDLHMEFSRRSTRILGEPENGEEYINPEADVLILAGDIITSTDPTYILDKFKNAQIPIIYVPGNHEYYGSIPYPEVLGLLERSFADTAITLLNPGVKVIDDVVFIGATMWTNLSNPMNEWIVKNFGEINRSIPDMTTNIWHNTNIAHVQHIKNCMSFSDYQDMKKVVITHYLPHMNSVPPQFKTDSTNAAFVCDCEDIMCSEVAPELWLHGHTHDSCDYVLGGTRVVCNPYGYWPHNINKKWDNKLLIEI